MKLLVCTFCTKVPTLLKTWSTIIRFWLQNRVKTQKIQLSGYLETQTKQKKIPKISEKFRSWYIFQYFFCQIFCNIDCLVVLRCLIRRRYFIKWVDWWNGRSNARSNCTFFHPCFFNINRITRFSTDRANELHKYDPKCLPDILEY